MQQAQAPSKIQNPRSRGKQTDEQKSSSPKGNHDAPTQVITLNFPLDNEREAVDDSAAHTNGTIAETAEITKGISVGENNMQEDGSGLSSVESPPAAKKIRLEVKVVNEILVDMSFNRETTDEMNPLTVKIMSKFLNRELSLDFMQLVYNFHGTLEYGTDNSAEAIMSKFLYLGNAESTVNALDLVKVYINDECKFARLLALLYLVQDVKEHDGKKLADLYNSFQPNDWSKHFGNFFLLCLRYFGPMKYKVDGSPELKKVLDAICCGSGENEKGDLLLSMEKALLTAINETESNCTKCTKRLWYNCYGRYAHLLFKMAMSKTHVHPLNELCFQLSDSASSSDICIFCSIGGEKFCRYFIHRCILSIWTGKDEKAGTYQLEMSADIVETFIQLLYHDDRVSVDKCLQFFPHVVVLCTTFKIPNPWRLLDIARLIKLQSMSEMFINVLQRIPEAWVNEDRILQLLDVATMKQIIASDELNLPEIQVACLCQRWAHALSDANRSALELFSEVEGFIRIPLISGTDFFNTIRKSEDALFKALNKDEIIAYYFGDKKIKLSYSSKPRNLIKYLPF